MKNLKKKLNNNLLLNNLHKEFLSINGNLTFGKVTKNRFKTLKII